MRTLKKGDRGKEVLDVQSRLRRLGFDLGTDGVDGFFGEDTRRAVLEFQQGSGLVADGIVAENTWCELVEARYETGERLLYLRIPSFRGADVLSLQRSLDRLGFNAGAEDGIFGSQTERAVLDFQTNAGLLVDGMVDESVLNAMARVTKDGELHSAEAKIPDRNGGYANGRSLERLVVVIDAGHGGTDPGASVSNGCATEKDVNLRTSLRLSRELQKLGSKVVLTRDDDRDMPLYERPALANAAGADVFLSIHHNATANRAAQGAAGYFFRRQGYYSEAGRMLAGHIVACLADAMDVPELPVFGRNYAVLRETEMMAVMIEPVFLTSPPGSEIPADELAEREADALFRGLREYFAIS